MWERAGARHPLDRALVLLEAGEPDGDRRALAALPIGARDARLCALYRRWFGSPASVEARCPVCATAIELELPLDRVDAAAPPARPRDVTVAGVTLRLRPPSSEDLAAVADAGAAAVDRLAERCVVDVGEAATAELPAAVRAALPEALRSLDPDADLVVETACPDCTAAVDLVVDPLSLLWTELDGAARRLLAEVHRLAARYGWSEEAILSMPPARRRHYLALAAS
jgi:hypothetical protein